MMKRICIISCYLLPKETTLSTMSLYLKGMATYFVKYCLNQLCHFACIMPSKLFQSVCLLSYSNGFFLNVFLVLDIFNNFNLKLNYYLFLKST